MTIVDTFSVTIGLAIILTLLGSIVLEGLRRREEQQGRRKLFQQ